MRIEDARWLVVDTETTGLDPSKDRIVEFACVNPYDISDYDSYMIDPCMPIPCEASAIHHITDDMVEACATWESAMKDFKEWPGDTFLIAHNAVFDASFLPPLQNHKWLCTQRLAQHLVPNAPRFTNQCLRYYLGPGEAVDLKGLVPHRALADALVTAFVFRKLVRFYLSESREDTPEALVAYAASPVRFLTMPFGKHKGAPIEDVPRDYISWALNNMQDLSNDLRLQFQKMLM